MMTRSLQLTCLAAACVVAVVLAGCTGADDPALDQPPVSGNRANADEDLRSWIAAIGACLTERGFPAEPVDEGEGLQLPEINASQQQGFDAAMQDCRAQHGEVPPGTAPLSTEEVGAFYELLVEQADCLTRAGFPVRVLPSRQTWVAAYQAGGEDAVLPLAPGSDANAAEEACPSPTAQDIHQRTVGGS
ncbi:hypothetical protein [Ornithinimicrobium pekingense]|nr:hypothetical protein [Ornithinimicrobium pekingense]